MIFQQTDGIVLRMHPWSETSLIGSVFTRDYGRVSIVAKGARRSKSPFETALDLLSVSRVTFISKTNGNLNVLTEAKLLKRFQHVDRNLQRLYAAYYLVELLEKFTEHELAEPNLDGGARKPAVVRVDERPGCADTEKPGIIACNSARSPVLRSSQADLFDLASDTLRQLETVGSEVRAIVLRLELQLLRLSGHLPSFRSCVHCGVGIVPDRWIIYSPTSGGVVCRDCSTTGRFLMRVPQSVCDYMESFSVVDWRTIPLSGYIVEHRAAIRAMITKTIVGTIDQRLKLHPYLEELGR